MEVNGRKYIGVQVVNDNVTLEFNENWYNGLNKDVKEDIIFWMDAAIRIAKHRLNKKNSDLNEAAEKIWDTLLQMHRNFKGEGQFKFSYRDIMKELDWKYDKVKKWTMLLLKKRFITFAKGSFSGRGNLAKYKINNITEQS